MPWTFGQLLVELEALKKEDPKLLEQDLVINDGGEYFIELAVTLPGRKLTFIAKPETEPEDGG